MSETGDGSGPLAGGSQPSVAASGLPLTVEFEQNREDLEAQIRCTHRSFRNWLWVKAAAVVGGWAVLWLVQRSQVNAVVTLLALVALLVLAKQLWDLRPSELAKVTMFSFPGRLGRRRVTASDWGLSLSTAGTEQSWKWSLVSGVVRCGAHLLVAIGGAEPLFIPLRAFPDEAAAGRFRDTVLSRCGPSGEVPFARPPREA